MAGVGGTRRAYNSGAPVFIDFLSFFSHNVARIVFVVIFRKSETFYGLV
jgi:hypothetical protein